MCCWGLCFNQQNDASAHLAVADKLEIANTAGYALSIQSNETWRLERREKVEMKRAHCTEMTSRSMNTQRSLGAADSLDTPPSSHVTIMSIRIDRPVIIKCRSVQLIGKQHRFPRTTCHLIQLMIQRQRARNGLTHPISLVSRKIAKC